MGEIMSRTEVWCDICSLSPPDGLFVDSLKEALETVTKNAAGKEKPVIIRMMFGNIVGMPVNCRAVIKALTEDLPEDANIHLWVGAWRRGVSWNHAKIIAVDGKHLHTGGHNLWDGVSSVRHAQWINLVPDETANTIFPTLSLILALPQGKPCA